MRTGRLDEYKQTTLDGSGDGTVKLMPLGGSEKWLLEVASVKCSSNTSEAACTLYIGPGPADPYFIEYLAEGSTGQSTHRVKDLRVDTHENMMWAVWAGGDPGATATLHVNGQTQTP